MSDAKRLLRMEAKDIRGQYIALQKALYSNEPETATQGQRRKVRYALNEMIDEMEQMDRTMT